MVTAQDRCWFAKTPLCSTQGLGLFCSVSVWVICPLPATRNKVRSLQCRIGSKCLLSGWLSGQLKVLKTKRETERGRETNKNNLSPPHCSLQREEDKSEVPLNTKGRQSKAEQSGLTVWGRLVACNRCYLLINNACLPGVSWSCRSPPSWGPVHEPEHPQKKWTQCDMM